ncbi:MAG TPA: alpha/beta fold hydrolase [Ilumatobacter sp.]|nr:alpha/beta fold hydrolase [Ilumatobacter sp.]
MTDPAPVWADPVWVDAVGPDTVPARIAVHRLAPSPGALPLLVSHATGFHARCYRALAAALDGRFDVWGLDHRGHGSTPRPDSWRVDWRGYGTDTLAVARWLADHTGAAVAGFGHSMGGATLLMAAHAAPDLFTALVLFEPIAFPAAAFGSDPEQFPLVAGARRRRARFDSIEAALANYAAKPPLSLLRPDVLRDYVEFGFRPADPPPGVELCCAPDHEADTFAASAGNGVWEQLPELTVTATVVGSGDAEGPALVAPEVAARIPGARFVQFADQTHFGPLSHPAEVAALISPAV